MPPPPFEMAQSTASSFDDFKKLHDILVDHRGPNLAVLAEELESRTAELKKLLEVPPKNEANRAKIKTGKLEINDGEYKINEQFIQEATQLSDDFCMDEVEAARLLFRGSEEMQKLDRSAFQSAVFLYHTRRQNILQCLRLILSYAFNDNTDPDLRELAKNTVDVLSPLSLSCGQTFTERCILAMGSVRQSVEQLRAKEKHNRTLGLESTQSYKEDLELHIRFLINQHEELASSVYYLVKLKRATVSDFKILLNTVKTFEKHDIFTFHHMLPLYAFITMLCETDSPLSFEETIQLHKEMLSNYKSSPWPLKYIQASVTIFWVSEFNGLCNDPPTTDAPSLSKLDYMTDIFDPSKESLEEGAFEFLLAVCADVSAEWPLNAAKEELHRFLQTRVLSVDNRGHISLSFRSLMTNQIEVFIESFISNMADVLKDIKTREEEDVLLGRKTLAYELERFFLIIHYAYLGRRDAGMVFWSDPESNLHGFIAWASTRQTPFMAATFSFMLASLSLGKVAAEHAHSFLLDEANPGSAKRRTTYLSWDYIFKQFQLYISQLEKRSQQLVPANAFRPPLPPPIENTEPAPELSMMLDGFMRLISQIVQECPDAKYWLLHESPFRVIPALFELLGLQASIQLWDSIFSTITAFLTDKTEVINGEIWKAIDDWALGAAPPTTALQLGANPGKTFAQAGSEKLDAVVSSVHPAEAFVRLLATLVSPAFDDRLKDALPFPEGLGSMNRLSGIDPYVDFVLGTIFANTTVQNLPPDLVLPVDKQDIPTERLTRSQYRSFRPALQSSCLGFIYTCLSTFNEDLLNISASNIAIDSAMKSSSFETYAKLHPFARVMEHILTEKCFNVFYEILKLGVEDIQAADVPLTVIESILTVIAILDLALQMQPTFFNTVRPIVKRDDGMRKAHVTSNGYGSVEEAILHHLDIAVFLGLFVGSAHQDITLLALSLLEKLSGAPKLVSTAGPSHTFGRKIGRNRLLGIIESSPESRRILFNFIHQWEADVDEGPEMRYPLKFGILKLLNSSLSTQPNEYTLAHFLLGFGYDEQEGISLSVEDGGIGSGIALLHSILADVDEAVVSDDEGLSFDGGLCQLKNNCFTVFKRLWKASSTSSEMLYVLRANKLLFSQFMGEQVLRTNSMWDGTVFGCLEFFEHGKALGLCDYIERRASLFNYIALEIRQLAAQGASTMVSKYLSTLLGVTNLDGDPMQNIHILDLLDFLELEAPEALPVPTITCFHDLNLTAFQQNDQFGNPSFHLQNIEQILLLRKQELLANGTINPQDEDVVQSELTKIMDYLYGENQLRYFRGARLECLKSWATLVAVMLEDCEFESAAKTSFLLQALQAIMPKVESYSSSDIQSAQVLSSLTHSLIIHLRFDIKTFGKGRSSDLASDRIYDLFRVSLRCIQSPMATARLREDFYNIAYRSLQGTSDLLQQGGTTRSHSIQTIKASGDRLLEVLCNDAYSGEGQCKIVALLLLEALVALAANESSHYVVDALMRQNFLVVLVDSTKQIRTDLVSTNSNDIPYLMRSFKATTGFLVRIAQTRVGAGHVINAGLFKALRESKLFSVDPDLGVGINDPKALEKYYELLTHATRVVVACILSRGQANRQAITAGKQFLTEIRPVVLSVFKRHANIGGPRMDNIKDLSELVGMFVLLIALTDFVEYEESLPIHA